MPIKLRYYRGQGKLWIAEKDVSTGNVVAATGWTDVGNVTALTLRQTVGEIKHFESRSGQSLQDVQIETTKEAMADFTTEDMGYENLAKYIYGTATSVAGATVTSETVVAPAVGKTVFLARPNITTWTSLTNAAGSTTYVRDTDYSLDVKSGAIEILAGGAITAGSSLRANYTFGALHQVSAYTNPNKAVWLRFTGLNSYEGDTPVIVTIPKFRLKPLDQLPLIGNDLTSYQIQGACLYDETRPDSTSVGRFFDVQQVAIT